MWYTIINISIVSCHPVLRLWWFKYICIVKAKIVQRFNNQQDVTLAFVCKAPFLNLFYNTPIQKKNKYFKNDDNTYHINKNYIWCCQGTRKYRINIKVYKIYILNIQKSKTFSVITNWSDENIASFLAFLIWNGKAICP